jgi:hypothetical protein
MKMAWTEMLDTVRRYHWVMLARNMGMGGQVYGENMQFVTVDVRILEEYISIDHVAGMEAKGDQNLEGTLVRDWIGVCMLARGGHFLEPRMESVMHDWTLEPDTSLLNNLMPGDTRCQTCVLGTCGSHALRKNLVEDSLAFGNEKEQYRGAVGCVRY